MHKIRRTLRTTGGFFAFRAKVIHMKTCKKCGETKPLEDFYRHATNKDGRGGSCRKCHYERGRAWKEANPEKNAAHNRREKLRSKYGITPEQYDELLAEQGGVCACCGTDRPWGRYSIFHVDHDHSTWHVRGLLCNDCNRGIGWLGDDVAGVTKALEYLLN